MRRLFKGARPPRPPTFVGMDLAALVSKSRQQGCQGCQLLGVGSWHPCCSETGTARMPSRKSHKGPTDHRVRFRLGFPAFRYGGGHESRNIKPGLLFRRTQAEKVMRMVKRPPKQAPWTPFDRSLIANPHLSHHRVDEPERRRTTETVVRRLHYSAGVTPRTITKFACSSPIFESFTFSNGTVIASRCFSSRSVRQMPSSALPAWPRSCCTAAW